jgi:hypothetical protein
MYTQIWIKYLPIIRILMKKSITGEQTFSMNLIDFERAGVARKSGYKFLIHLSNGRVDNVISSSELAKDLASTLLQDEVVKELCTRNDYHITMNSKYQLGIKFVAREQSEEEVAVEEAMEVA